MGSVVHRLDGMEYVQRANGLEALVVGAGVGTAGIGVAVAAEAGTSPGRVTSLPGVNVWR